MGKTVPEEYLVIRQFGLAMLRKIFRKNAGIVPRRGVIPDKVVALHRKDQAAARIHEP